IMLRRLDVELVHELHVPGNQAQKDFQDKRLLPDRAGRLTGASGEKLFDRLPEREAIRIREVFFEADTTRSGGVCLGLFFRGLLSGGDGVEL
ncbi:MAG: hypothetical protein ACRD40_10490, partial [Candidatus Acidiferrales bacterium]